MSKFCNKHVVERTTEELNAKAQELEASKARDNARRELKRRAGMERHWKKSMEEIRSSKVAEV